MREGVAELTNRVMHLREANAGLEARLKAMSEALSGKSKDEAMHALACRLREDKKTDQTNWPFRSIEDFHMKADAANAIDRLSGEVRAACIELEAERKMVDFMAQTLEDTAFATPHGDVDPLDFIEEEGCWVKAWRAAIMAYMFRAKAETTGAKGDESNRKDPA